MLSCARPRGYPANRRLLACLQGVLAGYQPAAGCQPAPQPLTSTSPSAGVSDKVSAGADLPDGSFTYSLPRTSLLVVGTVTLVYDHHVRQLSEKLTGIQHDFHHSILSTLHVHLDHDHCLEVLVVRGKSAVVRKVADTLISTKGVKHGRLTITTTGQELK